MNEIKAYEYSGMLFRTKNSAILFEIGQIVVEVGMYGISFSSDSAYRNKERLIELLGELE